MKKALLLLLVFILLMSAACSAKQAEISASANSPQNITVTDTAVSDGPENTTATDNAENTAAVYIPDELKLYSYWKSSYERLMADWQPAQLFSTKEYTYGIDALSISQNDDGSYTVSFIFGVMFNLFIGDYRVDEYRPKTFEKYYPELYLDKAAERELTLEDYHDAGPFVRKDIGPYLTYYEYRCDVKPQALYFKTPEFRMIDVHAELVVDDPSLYIVEGGKTVSWYDNNTHTTREHTPAYFVFRESLNGKWRKATLRFNDGEISYGLWDGLRDDVYDYFYFELPESTSLDSGYTFTLSWEYVDLPRQVFEIDID